MAACGPPPTCGGGREAGKQRSKQRAAAAAAGREGRLQGLALNSHAHQAVSLQCQLLLTVWGAAVAIPLPSLRIQAFQRPPACLETIGDACKCMIRRLHAREMSACSLHGGAPSRRSPACKARGAQPTIALHTHFAQVSAAQEPGQPCGCQWQQPETLVAGPQPQPAPSSSSRMLVET